MPVDPSDLFWLLLLLVLLLPWLQKRLRNKARKGLLRKIEKSRESRLILLVHRQETVSLLGVPLFRYVDINDAEEVIRAIRLTDPQVPIDLLIQTPGGIALACIQIARAIQQHPTKVTVFIPHYALSGGTLIALAADEIVMGPHAVLGPVDPQLQGFPAASIVNVLSQKSIEDIDDQTLIQSDVARKALSQMQEEVVELLGEKFPPEKAYAIAQRLSQGRWTHDHPISFRQAQELGLPISPDIPDDLYELMKLYPQPMRREPSVQYIPLPYNPPETKKETES